MPSDADDLALRDALVQMSFEVMGRLTQLAAEEGMSLTQLRVLGVLRDRRPRMADLAGGLGLDRSSVTGLIEPTTVECTMAERASELLADVIAPLPAATRASLPAGLEQAFVARF